MPNADRGNVNKIAALSGLIALVALATGCATGGGAGAGAGTDVTFVQSAAEVDAYDFVEVTATVTTGVAANPFTDVIWGGHFQKEGGAPVRVEGFCDSADGRVFRARLLPAQPGRYSYVLSYAHGGSIKVHAGTFTARDGHRKGLVRIDRAHPYHFVWEGTGDHYFWNSTTTYGLVGWDDDTIRRSIDRLAALKVNRLRVTLDWRVKDGHAWYEEVYPTDRYTMKLNPWVAARPDSLDDPGFDVTRFNVDHWQKYERLLRHARDKDVVVSVIFYTDGARKGTEPFGKKGMGGPDEERYYRYAAARLASFSNVMWDVSNEYQLFRNEPWAEKMGTLLKEFDPYDHLTSIHGHAKFMFRKSPWADFAMYQEWDEGGAHGFLLKHRQEQQATGRPMPQINEEYGYEDHYPVGWGGNKKAPARSGDNRRRLAWGMYMAGGYQTTGERADTGTGHAPDTGGGWINGRGDDGMVMLKGYGHIMTFFTSFEWWKTDPKDDRVDNGAYCLAEEGRQYAVYLPAGGQVTVQLAPGTYRARWFNPRTGTFSDAGIAEGPRWTSPAAADGGDWALLLVASGP